MLRIIKYVLLDILQNRIIIGYTLFLLAVSFGLFNLSADPTKGMVGLLNIVLIVTPLVSIVFSTIHFYNSYEFIEVLAAQPIKRSLIVWSEFAGLATGDDTGSVGWYWGSGCGFLAYGYGFISGGSCCWFVRCICLHCLASLCAYP